LRYSNAALSRRSLLKLAGWAAAGTAALAPRAAPAHAASRRRHAAARRHTMGPVGRVSTERSIPATFRALELLDLPPASARDSTRDAAPDGTLLREYELVAVDREIEIAPGMFFPAWTFNGQVPGRRCARPKAIASASRSSTRVAPAHDSFPRLASAGDGRLAAGAPGAAGRRSSTSSTPSRSAAPVSLPRRRR
jgi:hypothetical protein